jgi:hypothetical protein
MLEEVKADRNLEIVQKPSPMQFNSKGNLF